MTDKPTRKEMLQKLVALGVGADVNQAHPADTTSASIGTPDTSVDAYLGSESLRWLKAQIGTSGTAYLDTIELNTEDGTIVFESDSPIEVSFKQDSDERQ